MSDELRIIVFFSIYTFTLPPGSGSFTILNTKDSFSLMCDGAISAYPSCFYPRQDDAEKDGETERCLPVYSACSMNDEVPKQSHDDGNNQTYSKHGYKINE